MFRCSQTCTSQRCSESGPSWGSLPPSYLPLLQLTYGKVRPMNRRWASLMTSLSCMLVGFSSKALQNKSCSATVWALRRWRSSKWLRRKHQPFIEEMHTKWVVQ
eukprot:Lithocolla_globosa_v1_NODE_7799_length_899_cov_17.803318.p2 type:complete len:104 gc:universal NODE_7799_length_899_cov_17.803318:313-2(-)